MLFESQVKQGGKVSFPEFTGERIYMRAFTKAGGLPSDLKRWQDTVDQMLDGVDALGPIYLMVDQAPVRTGLTQRRPGVHVDGYWDPGLQCHPQDQGGHAHVPSRHKPTPSHRTRHTFGLPTDESLILAANVLGCVGYVGGVYGTPGQGGDCSAIDVSDMERVEFAPGTAWRGHTARMLHESIPVSKYCLRTVVRLNAPGVSL